MCVAKAWLLLITSCQFIKSQMERASSQNPKVLVLIEEDDIYNVQSEVVLLLSQNHVGYEVEPLDVGFPVGSTHSTKHGKVFLSLPLEFRLLTIVVIELR